MDIFEATRNGDYDRVKELLDNGVDVNIINNNNTPLHYACQHGYIKIVKLLIERKANINALDLFKVSPLSYACYYKEFEIAKLLLKENNANVNIVDNDGYTLLHYVCNHNNKNINEELIELVISYGVDDFTVKNNLCNTPLDFLRKSRRNDLVEKSRRNDLVEKYKDYKQKGKLIKAAKKKK